MSFDAPAQLVQAIRAADAAITAEDFDVLMDFYADDATLVIKPGLSVTGKADIRQAFVAIAGYFRHGLVVKQDPIQAVYGGGTTLVIMESLLEYVENDEPIQVTRRATYVFRQEADGKWVCLVDNSYGTDLLAGDEVQAS